MNNQSVLINISGKDLETIIFDCVDKAIKLNQCTTLSIQEEIGGIELAQQITGLSKARIYALVSKREIPHKKRGKHLYFKRTELLEWIEKGNRKVKGGALC